MGLRSGDLFHHAGIHHNGILLSALQSKGRTLQGNTKACLRTTGNTSVLEKISRLTAPSAASALGHVRMPRKYSVL